MGVKERTTMTRKKKRKKKKRRRGKEKVGRVKAGACPTAPKSWMAGNASRPSTRIISAFRRPIEAVAAAVAPAVAVLPAPNPTPRANVSIGRGS